MKALLGAVLAIQSWTASSAPFRNLGFDEANTNTTQFFIPSDPSLPRPEGVGPPEDLVPGWQLLNGTNSVSFVGYNLLRTNGSWFTLITKRLDPDRVQGSYALSLPESRGLRLRQRGDIPPNATILTFTQQPGDKYLATLNGERLRQVTVDLCQCETRSSFDVSAFAGQNAELELILAQDAGMIDSIEFVVPLQLSLISSSDKSLTLSWSPGTGPYLIQEKSNLRDTNWINVLTTSNMMATVARVGQTGFFRISDHATNSVSQLTVSLDGTAERPTPVSTSATGFGAVSIEGTTLTYNIAFSGLSGPATAAHIHGPAGATEAGEVIVGLNFPAAASGMLSGNLDLSMLTPEQVNAIKAGNVYVNIHTLANPDGEIRGQLVP